ncbi:GNAT family N-acetyltransferase [Paenibacillus gansuensis]|uniref:GNAT family N-acetyltransferase n=1 Tax=Paenibacillus gansuensis TaxID=306542 RepID=A0ABW5P6Y1_9BACL
MSITLKRLKTQDQVDLLDTEFSKHYPWFTQSNYHETCLAENEAGTRVTMLAYYNDDLAGCCHLLRKSKYPYFEQLHIPEINNLNVFPQYRKQRVASTLLDELENIAAMYSKFVGLGVGLYKDYGNAQRMYCKRGYVLDGNGVTYQNVEVNPGTTVMVDDDLLLYLMKEVQ